MIAGFSAILSTLCYSEFAVRFPLSGGVSGTALLACLRAERGGPTLRCVGRTARSCIGGAHAQPQGGPSHSHCTRPAPPRPDCAPRPPRRPQAFNYLLFSLGEFVAFGAVATLMLEYVLANAAVARSFSPYFGQLIGKHSEYFTFPMKGEPSRGVEPATRVPARASPVTTPVARADARRPHLPRLHAPPPTPRPRPLTRAASPSPRHLRQPPAQAG